MKKYLCILCIAFLLSGCATKVRTYVSSTSHSDIPVGRTFYVALLNKSVTSQKIKKIIKDELALKDFRPTTAKKADIIVSFTAGLVGSNTNVGNSDHREIRIHFYDGVTWRSKKNDLLLWRGVGKSSGFTRDIIKVAPQIVASIFEEVGKDANSIRYIKKMP